MINIQSTIHNSPDLCKNVSLAVNMVSTVNSYTNFTQSDVYTHPHTHPHTHTHTHTHTHIYIYVYTYSSQYREAGRAKEIKIWNSSERLVPRKSVSVQFWTRVP